MANHNNFEHRLAEEKTESNMPSSPEEEVQTPVNGDRTRFCSLRPSTACSLALCTDWSSGPSPSPALSCSAEWETISMQDLGSSILSPPPRATPLAFSSPMPQSSSRSSRGVRRREKRAADSALDTSLAKALQMIEDRSQGLENVMHRATRLSSFTLIPFFSLLLSSFLLSSLCTLLSTDTPLIPPSSHPLHKALARIFLSSSMKSAITSCMSLGLTSRRGNGPNDWDHSEMNNLFCCCSDISGVRH